MVKSREDVEKLKQNWRNDPCFDIEDMEGFEEHHDELKAYRLECEAQWANAREKHRERLASKVCPMSLMNCLLDKCAWWNEHEECCAIRALNLRNGI